LYNVSFRKKNRGLPRTLDLYSLDTIFLLALFPNSSRRFYLDLREISPKNVFTRLQYTSEPKPALPFTVVLEKTWRVISQNYAFVSAQLSCLLPVWQRR